MKLSTGFIFLLLAAVSLGCGEHRGELTAKASTELSEESQSLLSSLHGRWRLQHLVLGFCPQSLGQSPFMGESRWDTETGELKMTALGQNTQELVLQVQDGQTLTRQSTVEIEGCLVSEEITMTIKQMNGRYAEGVYAAHYYHDGSTKCAALANSYDIQESCSVTADWSGVRLSRQP